MKNLVILDGAPLFDDSVDSRAWNNATLYTHTSPEQLIERLQGVEAICTNKVTLTQEILEQSSLKYIGVLATGYDIIDIKTAQAKDIIVTNVPAYSTDSVAQLTFALMLEMVNQVGVHSQLVKAGEWQSSQTFSFWRTPLIELKHKTLGIVGAGDIGLAVANIAQAFGMNVKFSSRSSEKMALRSGGKWTQNHSLEEVLSTSDFVTVHCPLTDSTRNLFDANAFAQMKRGSFFINTARGSLVVEHDLYNALATGHLAGAGLDVLSVEPMAKDSVLRNAPNCIVTPHIAWATTEARQSLLDIARNNYLAFVAGKPINRVV